MGDNSNFVFRQKLVGEDGSVRRGVVMVKQPGLFSPKLYMLRVLTAVCRPCMSYRYIVLTVLFHLAEIF